MELPKSRSSGSHTLSISNAEFESDPDYELSTQTTMDWIARSGTDTFASDRSGTTTMDQEVKKGFLSSGRRRARVVEIGSTKQSKLESLDEHGPY